MNTNVFRNLSYGVYVISSLDGERNTGCIATVSCRSRLLPPP